MRILTSLLLSSCLIVLAGCAEMSATLPPAGVETPPLAPRTVGANMPTHREHQRILANYGGVYEDRQLESLLASHAARLAKASGNTEVSYRITVLNSPSINAFALPTGDLYITRGLVALTNDDSEIAAVLAHEMGHVLARHAFARADRERRAVLVSQISRDILNDPNASALSLARSRISLASFSRLQELEADEISVQLLAAANFDPFGASRFLTTMGKHAQLRKEILAADSQETQDFLSNHPPTRERIALTEETARKIGQVSNVSRDRTAFLRAINGMVYGDDPAQGYVRGNRFIHPQAGFMFEAPSGFVLENSARTIVGTALDKNAFRLDSVPQETGKALDTYLSQGLIDNISISNVQEKSINGLPAAVALARGQNWTFRMAAIAFNDRVYRMIYASSQFNALEDKRFMSAIESFRMLGENEYTALRPQRLAVVTVQGGENTATLAARMAVNTRQMDQFLVLNALPANAAVQAGDQVKLIVE